MKRSIFISRQLSPESALLQFLNANRWEYHCRSLIRMKPIPFRIQGTFHWWFFSSSNGVKTVLEVCTPGPNVKLGVVGAATATTLRQFGLEPAFVGNSGNMEIVGRQFANAIGGQTVLFLGAEGGSERIRKGIPSAQCTFVPVYRTIQLHNITLPETEVVFLTSPSNAEAYLTARSLAGSTVIAIGTTTAQFLSERGIAHVLQPQSPTEADVVELLCTL